MTRTLARTAALALGAVALTLPASATAAPPACDDAVTAALHAAHEATGDPAGAIHEVEETYCSVG